MEIAHSHAGVFRLIGKAVLLGFLVILFAKVIVTLAALVLLGLLVIVCARAVYLSRAKLLRLLLRTIEALRSVVGPAQTRSAALAATAAGLLAGAWPILTKFCRKATTVGALLGQGIGRGCVFVWSAILSFLSLGIAAPRACFRLSRTITRFLVEVPVRLCRGAVGTAGVALAKVRSRSSLICSTLLEAASGAVVGALVFYLPRAQGNVFPPDLTILGPRACAAAGFGAFLGIVLGLSRMTGAAAGESRRVLNSRN